MDKSKTIGSEITVRISLAFQDAPDVHTLLAMTPVRERGKLVRLALQRYIEATAHPAGDVEAQIAAISQWLRDRASESAVDVASSIVPSHIGPFPINENRQQKIGPSVQTDVSDKHLNTERGNERSVGITTSTKEFESPSMRRWLSD
ncbi:hypothetical protein SAMN04515620_13447 [Collimonas sp. OK607]|uniref:hypothetical protein n=1 Tax=Collimonas sp. OK607 TaxID=1798194 RepID=UPI0008E23EE9|nr:hypothetical protein [Collimonas sp. OK607]SFB27971.1 hypothetical protein SAMN04515620_13447 [Collimonas sp. OK607]